jgi:hypothetical protein
VVIPLLVLQANRRDLFLASNVRKVLSKLRQATGCNETVNVEVAELLAGQV